MFEEYYKRFRPFTEGQPFPHWGEVWYLLQNSSTNMDYTVSAYKLRVGPEWAFNLGTSIKIVDLGA